MSDKKPVRDDVSQKIFFKNPERFADFCNTVLYGLHFSPTLITPLISDGLVRENYEKSRPSP